MVTSFDCLFKVTTGFSSVHSYTEGWLNLPVTYSDEKSLFSLLPTYRFLINKYVLMHFKPVTVTTMYIFITVYWQGFSLLHNLLLSFDAHLSEKWATTLNINFEQCDVTTSSLSPYAYFIDGLVLHSHRATKPIITLEITLTSHE